MNSYLNFVLEANISLTLFLIVYFILLRNETNFRFKRFVALAGIACSIVFPFLHFQSAQDILPTLGSVVPTVYLPEFSLTPRGIDNGIAIRMPSLALVGWAIYMIVSLALLLGFILELCRLWILIKKARPKKQGDIYLAITNEPIPSFSFFRFIVIGHGSDLTDAEKQQIIEHERVHAADMHSFDILLVNVIGIIFWFNPCVRLYKNLFIQLHEFEADARAVKTRGASDYCNLLARVALLSADLRIANYFSNSLTLKRIQMIRKIKPKIRAWRFISMLAVLPLLFFLVACHEQVMDEVNEIAAVSTMPLEVPANIQERFETLKRENPSNKYLLIEMEKTGSDKLAALEKQYGLPSSMEVFKLGEENYERAGEPTAKASAASGIKLEHSGDKSQTDSPTFIILEYSTLNTGLTELKQDNDVFNIVEESASFPGGMTELHAFLGRTIKYPSEAFKAGVEGKVFVEFIVEKDGSVTNVAVKRGVHPAIDAEAIRVISSSPPWIPGKQKGAAVRQRMVLPIAFSTGGQ
jgi:TonB family protein